MEIQNAEILNSDLNFGDHHALQVDLIKEMNKPTKLQIKQPIKRIEWTESNKIAYNNELNKLLMNVDQDIELKDKIDKKCLKEKVFNLIGKLHDSMRIAANTIIEPINDRKTNKRNRWWDDKLSLLRKQHKESTKIWQKDKTRIVA